MRTLYIPGTNLLSPGRQFPAMVIDQDKIGNQDAARLQKKKEQVVAGLSMDSGSMHLLGKQMSSSRSNEYSFHFLSSSSLILLQLLDEHEVFKDIWLGFRTNCTNFKGVFILV